MSQSTLSLPNSSGAIYRAAVNGALAAFNTLQSGSSRPSSATGGTLWLNSSVPSTTVWTLYVFDGTDDIPLGTVDTVANLFYPALQGSIITPAMLSTGHPTWDASGNLTTASSFMLDANSYFKLQSGNPYLAFDANDYLVYDRTNNTYNFYIGGSLVGSLNASGFSGSGSQLTNVPGRLLRAPQILTSGTSYTTPAGCNSIYVEAVGGGGGGGGNAGNACGGSGGGGGAYCAKFFSVTPLTAYSYAIGAGGAGYVSLSGANGGNTTFTVGGATITSGGGSGGIYSLSSNVTSGGAGGTSTGGDFNASGGGGGFGLWFSGGGGTTGYVAAGAGGSSVFGGCGQGVAGPTGGAAGKLYGGGGGGSGTNAAAGGSGANGAIRIWEYAL